MKGSGGRVFRKIIDIVKQDVRWQWVLRVVFVTIVGLPVILIRGGGSSFLNNFCIFLALSIGLSMILWRVEKKCYSNPKVYSSTAILLTIPELFVGTWHFIASVNYLASLSSNQLFSEIKFHLIFDGQLLWLALILQILAFLYSKIKFLKIAYGAIFVTLIWPWFMALYLIVLYLIGVQWS
jgi:hypothetical protein